MRSVCAATHDSLLLSYIVPLLSLVPTLLSLAKSEIFSHTHFRDITLLGKCKKQLFK